MAGGFREALEAIASQKARAGLTVLGVATGVAVVMAVAALISGVRGSVLAGFAAAGPDNFIVTRFDLSDVRLVGGGAPSLWSHPEISETEVRAVARLPGIREAVIDFDFSSDLSFRDREITGVQSGANSEGWPAYTLGAFVAGRNFLAGEVRAGRPVVVLSLPLARELFGEIDPIGRRVRVSSEGPGAAAFTVVGLFEVTEQIFADVMPQFAIFPYSAAIRELGVSDDFLSLLVVPGPDLSTSAAIDRVTATLRSLRGLRPGDANDFHVLRASELADLFDQLTAVFFLVLLTLSSVALLVGGIGVVGIMTISVTERTREIGIRKAVGAGRKQILWQFLAEAILLTLAGAALGLAVGGAGAEVVAARTPIPAHVPPWAVAAALTVAGVSGILFGLLPAIRAARLDPVEALRQE